MVFYGFPLSLAAFDVVFDCSVGRASDAAIEFPATPEVAAPVVAFPQPRKSLEQSTGADTLQQIKHLADCNRRLKAHKTMNVIRHHLHCIDDKTIFICDLPQNLLTKGFYLTSQNTIRVLRLQQTAKLSVNTNTPSVCCSTPSGNCFVQHHATNALNPYLVPPGQVRPERNIKLNLTIGKQTRKTRKRTHQKNRSPFICGLKKAAVFRRQTSNKPKWLKNK